MNRLLIDVTELAHWEGKLTGVPRVMDELSRRFAAAPNNVLVVWHAENKCYKVHSPSSPTFVPKKPAASSRSDITRSVVKKLRQRSRLANKVLHLSSKAVHRFMAPKPRAEGSPTIRAQAGDTLIVLADWHGDDPAFINYLEAQKARGVMLIQIAYDLLPIITPQYSGHATDRLITYTRRIYPLCDVVLAISEHTKKDIIKWMQSNNFKVPDIKVFRLGEDFKLADPVKPFSQQYAAHIGQKFLLCVGTIEARKNHTLLYYVYKLAKEKNIELPPLVVVGRLGWNGHDIYKIMTTDPYTMEKMIILESASDEELAWLYRNCLFSIYPSFYEGWGLPIAESIAYGSPCICSNTSSMPEVAGNLIGYFSPHSTDDCLRAIVEMLQPEAQATAKQKLQSYKPTSWDETFGQVSKIISEIHDQST